MQRFAVFDIDGTIFRWQLYHELYDALRRREGSNHDTSIDDARRAWRERELSYAEYEDALVNAMSDLIVGMKVSELERISDEILSNEGKQTYTYTLSLLKRLKTEGYMTIAVSGSHQQLVDRFCTMHGIDVGVGRRHIVVDGAITADVEAVIGRKHEIVRELVASHGLTMEGSYAVGDSGGDIAMLEIVEHPIAFNPTSDLLDAAKRHGWPIVIERKSIAYRLERSDDGSYILAAPDARETVVPRP